MTMTKKEQAVVNGIRNELALERALGWPRYEEPSPLPLPTGETSLRWDEWQRGWRTTGVSLDVRAEEIERDGTRHRVAGGKGLSGVSTSRGCPMIYASKVDALKANRWAMTRYCASLLAGLDADLQKALEETPPKP